MVVRDGHDTKDVVVDERHSGDLVCLADEGRKSSCGPNGMHTAMDNISIRVLVQNFFCATHYNQLRMCKLRAQ